MPSVRIGPVIGLLAQVALLAILAGPIGLTGAGWVVGISYGVVSNTVLARGLARAGADAMRFANQVTLARSTLVGGVAALTADSLAGHSAVPALVALAVVALVLDAVDGWVARRTQTTSPLGARFDMEVDAFLILVLSVFVAPTTGVWVLAIGAMRYAFVAARWLLPWMKGSPPPRYWCKVVAAIQGIVLTIAAADVLPHTWTIGLLAGSLALLAESFGREVWWLWRHRAPAPDPVTVSDQLVTLRALAVWVTTAVAGVLVWFALVAPNQTSDLVPGAFVRIPVEGLIVVALVVVLPDKGRRVVAALVGVVLGLLTVVKVLDMGFFEVFDRPFNPVSDWRYFGSGVGVLSDSVGHDRAIGLVVVVAVLVLGLLVVMPLSVMRLTRLASGHRTGSIRTVMALGAIWVLCAVFGAQIVPGDPIASASAAGLAYDQVIGVRDAVHDRQVFAKQLAAVDPFGGTPADDLLTGLRGKDVIVAFVESYGRVAVQDSAFSPPVDAVLDSGTERLEAAGFSSRSAFLTSPTFGGISWLAHSTLQSGLWVDSQQRYDQLVDSDRFTLSDAFKRAGWRTVSDVPSNSSDWSEGTSFYHYDKLYDLRNVGYDGPEFSYASMPDQYTLSAFQRLELAKAHRPPVMAEIDLVSSHTPWTPIPQMIDWGAVGDGSIYDRIPAVGQSPEIVWRDSDDVKAAYGRSVQYSLNALVSFVQTYGDKNLVLIVLGDHQPATVVSGDDAGHDVPVTIIARDPAVMDGISRWHWQKGMRPGPHAPVWPMNAFRNRFLTAYGP